MDRKNRVKMLINKLWKTRQIQAAFEIRGNFTGWFLTGRLREPGLDALHPERIHRPPVNYPVNC